MIKIINKLIYIFPLLCIFIFSCGEKDGHYITEDKFIEILLDIHIYDAILNKEGLTDKNITVNDSLSYYNYLYKKHNITRIQFREALEYYSQNTEKFSLMYDKIMIILNQQYDSIINLEITQITQIDTSNLWNLKDTWNLPEDGKYQTIKYSIDSGKHGIYTLSADIKLHFDDGTVNPRMSIHIYYTDGTYDSNMNGTMQKNGEWKNHKVIIKTDDSKQIDYISGWLLDHSIGTKAKHSEVKNIVLKFSEE
jgi:hypothetical protein